MKIKELIIYTKNVEAQYDFYTCILGLATVEKTNRSCSLKVGNSILTFQYNEEAKPTHFAFNIPSNKEMEALHWLKQRVAIISFEGNELATFKSWNAKAMYFYDADGNIVEFISRKNLNISYQENFSFRQILSISEIGMATTNIGKTIKELKQIYPIEIFSGDTERFCAVGNDHGLFILANPELKEWFPSGDKIYLSDFIIKGDHNFKYFDGKIAELS